MPVSLRAIEYHLPARQIDNAELAALSADWTAEKILEKTGIAVRHVVGPEECASDLAVAAAKKLFDSGACQAGEIDFVLLCTQSPDYFLPTSACLVQERLGIPRHAGALDFNLGCSGFVYGLGMASGLLQTGQASKVLLLCADTYSKFLAHDDLSVRTIFSDAGSAALVVNDPAAPASALGPFIYGSDGSGAMNLCVAAGACREMSPPGEALSGDVPRLVMNGPEIFAFTLGAVPKAVRQLLEKAQCSMDDVDLFVFHQANAYMLEHLRAKMKIAPEKFLVDLREVGNTVSCSIPIALARAQQSGRIKPGMRVMLVGFGVGYSWGATLLRT